MDHDSVPTVLTSTYSSRIQLVAEVTPCRSADAAVALPTSPSRSQKQRIPPSVRPIAFPASRQARTLKRREQLARRLGKSARHACMPTTEAAATIPLELCLAFCLAYARLTFLGGKMGRRRPLIRARYVGGHSLSDKISRTFRIPSTAALDDCSGFGLVHCQLPSAG